MLPISLSFSVPLQSYDGERFGVVSYYRYDPSEAAAIVAAILFGVGLIISVFQTIRSRAWIWLTMCVAVASKSRSLVFLHQASQFPDG